MIDEINRRITLDQSKFYPRGGAQPADNGIITFGEKVLLVKRAERSSGHIYHSLDDEEALSQVGDVVYGSIDWRRYGITRRSVP